MVVLRLFNLAAGLVLAGHAALQATLAMAAEAGQDLHAIQGRYQVALHTALLEDLAALEPAVHLHQQGLERVQVEAREAVAEGVIAKGALRADPMRQIGVAQLAVPLLEARETKHEGVKQARKTLAGEMSGSKRASFIWAACWRRSKPLLSQAEKEGRECVRPEQSFLFMNAS
jgi:hypothetical protein